MLRGNEQNLFWDYTCDYVTSHLWYKISFFLFFIFFILERERERESTLEGERGKGWERERIFSRIHAQYGAWHGAWSHDTGSWPELKSRVGHSTTEPPMHPNYLFENNFHTLFVLISVECLMNIHLILYWKHTHFHLSSLWKAITG